jgi:hypothetical protein
MSKFKWAVTYTSNGVTQFLPFDTFEEAADRSLWCCSEILQDGEFNVFHTGFLSYEGTIRETKVYWSDYKEFDLTEVDRLEIDHTQYITGETLFLRRPYHHINSGVYLVRDSQPKKIFAKSSNFKVEEIVDGV